MDMVKKPGMLQLDAVLCSDLQIHIDWRKCSYQLGSLEMHRFLVHRHSWSLLTAFQLLLMSCHWQHWEMVVRPRGACSPCPWWRVMNLCCHPKESPNCQRKTRKSKISGQSLFAATSCYIRNHIWNAHMVTHEATVHTAFWFGSATFQEPIRKKTRHIKSRSQQHLDAVKRLFPAACSFYLWPPPNRPIGVSKVGSPMRLLRKSPVFQTNLCPHGPVQTSQDSVGKSGRCSELRWFPLLSQLPKSDWGLQTLGSNHRGVFGPALVTSCYCYPICILFYPIVPNSHLSQDILLHHTSIISYPIVVVKKCQESVGSLLFTKPSSAQCPDEPCWGGYWSASIRSLTFGMVSSYRSKSININWIQFRSNWDHFR